MKFNFAYVLILSTTLNCIGQDAVQNSGNFRMHTGAKLGFFGNLTNNGTITNSAGEIHLAGTALQTINGSNSINSYDLTINNSNDIKVDNQLEIANSLTFTNGQINTDIADAATEFIHFLDGSSHSGTSDAKHIDGVVRKTGDDPFIFPVGDDANLQEIAITDPGTTPTDHFTAYYIEQNSNSAGYLHSSKVAPIYRISVLEYWILNRTGGTANVDVILNFDANSGGITDLADLVVTRWDGSTWQNHGNVGTTGTIAAGTVSSDGTVSSFSPFSIGSISTDNPLPIELISFNTTLINDYAQINWKTATEINNASFELEKSTDLFTWEVINIQEGAGNSLTEQSYDFEDFQLVQGNQYYRIKQIDFDGTFSLSPIKTVTYGTNDVESIIYPNPTTGNFTIQTNETPINNRNVQLKIFDNLGKLVLTKTLHSIQKEIKINTNLISGHYLVKLQSEKFSQQYNLIVL